MTDVKRDGVRLAPTERTFVRLGAPGSPASRQPRRMHDHLAHPRLPPGPNRSPLRNLYRWTSEMSDFIAESHATYGDVFTLRIYGTRPMVCFTTSGAAREIMRENGARLGSANDILQSIVGRDNVILKNGAPHALHRRRLMPALTGEALATYVPTMKTVITEGVDALSGGERVRVVPWARRVALAVIQQCLFGMREGEEYRALADDVIRLAEEGQRPLALMASLIAPPDLLERVTRGRFATDGARMPDPAPVRALLGHPLVSANRRVQDRVFAHVRGAREGRIAVAPASMLAVLLELAARHDAEITDRTLVDDLITLLVAGHDTTAITFSWLVLMLGRNPEVLATLRRELAHAGGFDALEPERLGELPYLDAVIRESMRLTSIAAGFGRATLAPITICGVDLPAGVDVAALAIGAHREASSFADPLRFDPARMRDQRVRPESLFPFGGGYRRCIGAFFATVELKLMIAAFVERVSFEAVHREGPVGLGTKGIITEPADGALLRIDAIRGRAAAEKAHPRETAWRS